LGSDRGAGRIHRAQVSAKFITMCGDDLQEGDHDEAKRIAGAATLSGALGAAALGIAAGTAQAQPKHVVGGSGNSPRRRLFAYLGSAVPGRKIRD
jgi:hypothetical protein